MSSMYQPGKLVSLRGRDWIVLPSESEELLTLKPLGGSDDEIIGLFQPVSQLSHEYPTDARFALPSADDLGDFATARALYNAARLSFRNGAGPFRALAKLSFRPRSYQMVPLIMALRQEVPRLLIADDVGVGKTVESLLIVKELLERRRIKRFAVICLPHLCEQWQDEIRAKLDIEAVIIRSNTQARLDRQIQGDESVYDYYPFQVISIDFIKSDVRRDVFVEQCPEFVIVDEAHTCARPEGASSGQQQRFHLLSKLAAKPQQSLVLLTATPHSGKPEEFQSLLGLLNPQFEALDLPNSSQAERRELAAHFVQRKRADVEKWLGEDTPFPKRDAFELNYTLAADYAVLFEDLIEFSRNMISGELINQRHQRVNYWTALALLRGVMSSPAAGVEMLSTRLGTLTDADSASVIVEVDQQEINPVADTEFGFEGDNTPTQTVERLQWTDHQRKRLREFSTRLAACVGARADAKLAATEKQISQWLTAGFHPVIFCRYIATAGYVGEQLGASLKSKFPHVEVQVITSELPDDVRKQRITDMGQSKQRVLVATDCLSEGINLHDQFSAVLHYDLPWNPNRLEQREGRVDRFGQTAPEVKACLLFGANNPIDGIVLDVLLRKVREIKRSTGITTPFPEDSQGIIDTITQALLLNPNRVISVHATGAPIQQSLLDFDDLPEAIEAKAAISRKLDEAAKRETLSRSIFAQNAIKAQDIEADLKEVDDAIGNPMAVETFVTTALPSLFGVQCDKAKYGWRIVTTNLPPQLRELFATVVSIETINVSFQSPTPPAHLYLGRNHAFVEQLCQIVMANTMARIDKRAARTSVIRTHQVAVKTTLLLFRCRNVIEQSRSKHQIVAEEMMLWGWRGTPDDRDILSHEEAHALLDTARATADMSRESRQSFLENELGLLDQMQADFAQVAEAQSKRLVDAHERFSALMDRQRYQVVYPVLPMDLLGLYLLLPDATAARA